MGFVGSYLWRLRQRIGSELVLMPGTMVVVERSDGRVLLVRRSDTGEWCVPAGAAEPGGSFASTAVDELGEEAGIAVAASDLIPYGCLSAAEAHTIRYPNGDVTHCFAMCFWIRARDTQARGVRPDGEESTAAQFADPADLPKPMHAPSVTALELWRAYTEGGGFQVG